MPSIEQLAKDRGMLENCKVEMEKLGNKLEPATGWRKMKKSLMWPLREEGMSKAIDGLERFKSMLQLTVATAQA